MREKIKTLFKKLLLPFQVRTKCACDQCQCSPIKCTPLSCSPVGCKKPNCSLKCNEKKTSLDIKTSNFWLMVTSNRLFCATFQKAHFKESSSQNSAETWHTGVFCTMFNNFGKMTYRRLEYPGLFGPIKLSGCSHDIRTIPVRSIPTLLYCRNSFLSKRVGDILQKLYPSKEGKKPKHRTKLPKTWWNVIRVCQDL